MDEFPTTHPRILGVTGGIGAGKSTVGRMLEALGVPVWRADDAGRALYRSDATLRQWVADRWGAHLLVRNASGEDVDVDRAALGQIAFHSPADLAALSAQIHPRVAAAFAAWHRMQGQRLVPPAWVAREAAILFESETDRDCMATLTVEAPMEERIARVMQRDGNSAAAVEARIARQWSAAERQARARFTVHNGITDRLFPQICAICEELQGAINCHFK